MFGKKKNYEKNTSIMENDDVMINDKKAKVNEYLDSMEYMSKVVLEKKEALAIVNEDNLKLAIGRKAINVRLASKLTRYKIEVKTMEDIQKEGNK